MAGYTVGPNLKPDHRPWPTDWKNCVLTKVCHHPEWESVLLPPSGEFHVEEVVRCTRCHAPRCGDSRVEDPCMKVRHHTSHHTYLSGNIAPIGGVRCSIEGCDCAPARTPKKKVA